MAQFGKYEIEETLGSGATSDVYRARDKLLGRQVALKVLKPSLVVDVPAFERFLLEARSAAELFHPHIATVLDMGDADGRFYLAMRYFHGPSLDKVLKENGKLSWERILQLAQHIGSALDYAHAQGFLHRDVKPSNILCAANGDFILTDFGLTRAMMNTGLTNQTGAVLGTPAYIAPEVWAGRDASPATDQYSLACVVFECLTGQVLFRGDTPPEVMTHHILDGPELPETWPEDTPPQVGQALLKALERKPGGRYASCAAFADALGDLAAARASAKKDPPLIVQPVDDKPLEPVSPHPVEPKEQPAQPEPSPKKSSRWVRLVEKPVFRWVGLALLLIFVTAFLLKSFGISFGLLNPSLQPLTKMPVDSLAEIQPLQTAPGSDAPQASESPQAVPIDSSKPPANAAPGELWLSPEDGMLLAYIPAGEFQMGRENGDGDEGPVHAVYLDAFWMDTTEVTNAMWAMCVLAEKCTLPQWTKSFNRSDYYFSSNYADYPVINVSWNQAQAYCQWAGRSLPGEAQWEKAARGALVGMPFPWGDSAPYCGTYSTNGAQYWGCKDDTVAVGSFKSNPYGLFDMAGNVWEWVADWYMPDYYKFSPYNNPLGPSEGILKVVRGGGWQSFEENLVVTNRGKYTPLYYDISTGFRCAYTP